MFWVLFIGVYLLGAAFTGAPAARWMANDIGEPLGAEDWFMGAVMGLLLWYFLLPAALFTYAVKRAYRFILKTQKSYEEAHHG